MLKKRQYNFGQNNNFFQEKLSNLVTIVIEVVFKQYTTYIFINNFHQKNGGQVAHNGFACICYNTLIVIF